MNHFGWLGRMWRIWRAFRAGQRAQPRSVLHLTVRVTPGQERCVDVYVDKTEWEGVADIGEAQRVGVKFNHTTARAGLKGTVVWEPIGLFSVEGAPLVRVPLAMWEAHMVEDFAMFGRDELDVAMEQMKET